jgi:hypothetical protein
MQIQKDTIYFINHETIERFIDDVLSSGLLVRDDIRSKTNGFAMLIYKDKLYIPMSFWSENDYVYYSDQNACKTLKETLEYINQANIRIDKVFHYTMGTKAVLYKPKRVIL